MCEPVSCCCFCALVAALGLSSRSKKTNAATTPTRSLARPVQSGNVAQSTRRTASLPVGQRALAGGALGAGGIGAGAYDWSNNTYSAQSYGYAAGDGGGTYGGDGGGGYGGDGGGYGGDGGGGYGGDGGGGYGGDGGGYGGDGGGYGGDGGGYGGDGGAGDGGGGY